jgi:hypothetical protein
MVGCMFLKLCIEFELGGVGEGDCIPFWVCWEVLKPKLESIKYSVKRTDFRQSGFILLLLGGIPATTEFTGTGMRKLSSWTPLWMLSKILPSTAQLHSLRPSSMLILSHIPPKCKCSFDRHN